MHVRGQILTVVSTVAAMLAPWLLLPAALVSVLAAKDLVHNMAAGAPHSHMSGMQQLIFMLTCAWHGCLRQGYIVAHDHMTQAPGSDMQCWGACKAMLVQ